MNRELFVEPLNSNQLFKLIILINKKFSKNHNFYSKNRILQKKGLTTSKRRDPPWPRMTSDDLVMNLHEHLQTNKPHIIADCSENLAITNGA